MEAKIVKNLGIASIQDSIPKILIPHKEVVDTGWNKHYHEPLILGEKVVVLKVEIINPNKMLLTVKHGRIGNKVVSKFYLHQFQTVSGKEIIYKNNNIYIIIKRLGRTK